MDYSKKPGKLIKGIGDVVNKNDATISVITPFYNGGKTLMETANSLLSQTYPYFEWIIVDDGSKDKESLELLDQVSKLDSRIKLFHKKNGGPSLARDYGIHKSSKKSKYIFFLDCDDILDKTMLECLYWTLETHDDASFAYTTMVNFGDREFIWEKYLTVEQEKEENLICISSMIKKEDLLEVGCFGIKEKAMYEDWNLWLKLLAKRKKPIRVNAPLFWYRVSDTGEFSRAQQNNDNAMRYVNETAQLVDNDVEVIQFPSCGNKYDKVRIYNNMVLPKYKNNGKTKILFLFPWMVVGGADYFNLDLIKRLDSDKYESIVLTTLPSNNLLRQDFEEYASEVYDLSTFLERSDYINFTDYIIESRNINAVVVSNTTYGYYMVPYLKGKYPKIPFIDYIHSIDLSDPREGFGRCTMDVDKYLTGTYCCNNFTKMQLESKYNKVNVETLYIGTDDKKFDCKNYNRNELLEKYNIPKDKIIISFIARLSSEKRPLMFVEIAKRLLLDNKDLYFVIGGDGPLYDDVSNNIDNNFKMLGVVKSEEVFAFSDITINCSSLEGLALTSYESLSMSVPVVSSDVGGQTELIDSSVGGIVHYNDGADNDLYNKEVDEYCIEVKRVLKILDDIKNNCRKRIKNGFTLDIMVDKFSKIIDKSIEREKNTKALLVDYLEYELALECIYKDYYYYCKNYIETNYGIIYEYDNKLVSRGRFYNLKSKASKLLNRAGAKKEAVIILNVFRTFYQILYHILYFIKFLILSIPSAFILFYKLLVRNKK